MVSNAIKTITVGRARVHLIDLGTLTVDLADWLRVPRDAWTSETAPYLAQPIAMPALSVAIELPGSVALVDACDPLSIADSTYAGPGYQPRPDLIDQLAVIGIAPEQVGHVVLTHLHFDHYSGVAREQGGRRVPCFPRARHYVGRADWDAVAEELADPESLAYKTLGVIEQHGLLQLVEGDVDLTDELSVLAAPGETAGHQVVRVRSRGQTLYCLGDLYHHPAEIEHPEWQVYWADADASRRSRQRLVAAALAEDAIVTAAHIGAPGRLRAAPDGATWHVV